MHSQTMSVALGWLMTAARDWTYGFDAAQGQSLGCYFRWAHMAADLAEEIAALESGRAYAAGVVEGFETFKRASAPCSEAEYLAYCEEMNSPRERNER